MKSIDLGFVALLAASALIVWLVSADGVKKNAPSPAPVTPIVKVIVVPVPECSCSKERRDTVPEYPWLGGWTVTNSYPLWTMTNSYPLWTEPSVVVTNWLEFTNVFVYPVWEGRVE